MYPEVEGYSTSNEESFESYIQKWPDELNNIPACVIENWIYRHWSDFQNWIALAPEKWNYELRSFSNDEILKIDHVGEWPPQLLAWGEQLIKGPQRKGTWLGSFMLENGTTPKPIIVAKNFGDTRHPLEFNSPNMKEPFQLIEGHMRLSYLKGMIINNSENVNRRHDVWLVTK